MSGIFLKSLLGLLSTLIALSLAESGTSSVPSPWLAERINNHNFRHNMDVAGFVTQLSQNQQGGNDSKISYGTQRIHRDDILSSLGQRRTESETTEVGIPLAPFQVMLEYNDNDAMTNTDEMMVLMTTQNYLSSILTESEPQFSRLLLYQFVRDYPESQHYAKVAFSGTAFFFTTGMEQDKMQTEMLLGLVGKNSNNFVEALQKSGMKHVVNVTLMSIEGNELGLQEDGEISEMEDKEEVRTIAPITDRSMSDDMRMMTLLLSLSIPGAVICLACCIYACRSVREINWTKRPNPDSPVWHTTEQSRMSSFSVKEFEETKVEEV